MIVVGGGIAGLTAALSLLQKEKDVLLIEKNESCGGLMNSFQRDGFRFEGGARALVNAGLVKPLTEEFALNIEILPNPITLGVEKKLLKIDGEQSLDLYAALLKDLYPEYCKKSNGPIKITGPKRPIFLIEKNKPTPLAAIRIRLKKSESCSYAFFAL